ncbi:winged helix-turn-helix domain-containing protein [Streptomyces sp. JV176]|uniref:winged helix-turn-helix domain-containing protein n=1 Tax=Streptomyces sp. JV176 TaxID=858630 RepID=UPI002E7A7119|nr:winged helix-turn-helix domain-containing protein [Streptomyces sp. JV176]MEE1801457.1 winged helix-turn-helix domain-containing protein [Streptomyces sp. JV176]
MANSLSSLPGSFSSPGRHRLRAVDDDETPGALVGAPAGPVVDFLPPGATWLPAPQHTLPSLPGQPPMIGYLVLVPADQHPAGAVAPAAPSALGPTPVSVPATATAAVGGGSVLVDNVQRTAVVDGRPLDLTYLEFELLAHLVAHPHRVHSRDQLVTTVWGYGHVGDGRTVDVHVARLRRKLGADHRRSIQTVRRVGYKYIP